METEKGAVDLIQLRAAEIGYKKPILPAIDLTVRAGERIAILGPNGAGKSTLLRTIIGTLPILAGHMDYPLGRRPTMGYVQQSHQPDAAFMRRMSSARCLGSGGSPGVIST